MNQSLLSQSLSDLRHPPGSRTSGEWRMFSSDSDIKDIKVNWFALVASNDCIYVKSILHNLIFNLTGFVDMESENF